MEESSQGVGMAILEEAGERSSGERSETERSGCERHGQQTGGESPCPGP